MCMHVLIWFWLALIRYRSRASSFVRYISINMCCPGHGSISQGCPRKYNYDCMHAYVTTGYTTRLASKPVDLVHNHATQLTRFKTDRQIMAT